MKAAAPEQLQLASPEAKLLLTSAGVVTHAIKQAFHDTLLSGIKAAIPVITRFEDGWKPFPSYSGATHRQRVTHRTESAICRYWSNQCLGWAMDGQLYKFNQIVAGDCTEDEFRAKMEETDIALLDGGNTPSLAHGLERHGSTFSKLLNEGKIGAATSSAGTILMGMDSETCLIAPADTLPNKWVLAPALGIVGARFMVHASSRDRELDIVLPRCARQGILRLLNGANSTASAEAGFADTTSELPDISLTNSQAILIVNGRTETIGFDGATELADDFAVRLDGRQATALGTYMAATDG